MVVTCKVSLHPCLLGFYQGPQKTIQPGNNCSCPCSVLLCPPSPLQAIQFALSPVLVSWRVGGDSVGSISSQCCLPLRAVPASDPKREHFSESYEPVQTGLYKAASLIWSITFLPTNILIAFLV